eukprot:2628315-Rhodomonas_salina.1
MPNAFSFKCVQPRPTPFRPESWFQLQLEPTYHAPCTLCQMTVGASLTEVMTHAWQAQWTRAPADAAESAWTWSLSQTLAMTCQLWRHSDLWFHPALHSLTCSSSNSVLSADGDSAEAADADAGLMQGAACHSGGHAGHPTQPDEVVAEGA